MRGDTLPVIITVYEDRTYDFIMKKPPASSLIKKALKLESGAHNALTEKVGTLTQAQLADIAKIKMPDLNTTDLEAAKKIIAGTARQMGVEIK
jgi:large subunit ribosomal protein L11